jgi:hypothetical protein
MGSVAKRENISRGLHRAWLGSLRTATSGGLCDIAKQILRRCAEGLLGKTVALLVAGSSLGWTRSVVKLSKCTLKLLCGSCELQVDKLSNLYALEP